MQTTVWKLPHKSQEFAEGPRVELHHGSLTIAYDFETADGSYDWATLAFRGTEGFAYTGFPMCTAEQVEAYDRVVEVADSTWMTEKGAPLGDVHHYRVFFDDIGCFDVLAASFLPPGDASAMPEADA